jgi:DNA mismatch repair protein MutS
MSGVDIEDLRHRLKITIYALETWYFGDELAETTLLTHFKVKSLEALGLADYDCGMIAAGALLKYLYETQKNDLNNISVIHPYSTGKYMIIDSSTRRNLELVETLREKQKRGSLLWVLDKTKTAMGARLLRSYVEQPLIDKAEIEKRQDAICELNQHVITREELREYLNPIYDLERLITRVTYLTANPRDLIAFRSSIAMLPPIKSLLGDFQCELLGEIREDMDTLEELCALIDRAIMEEPPISVRDGGLIKDGYNEDVDKYRKAKTEGKTWLAELEAKEREKTGIKNLKIKYNKVFGYYLEVTNSYKDLVPDYFMRKQTLANAERYITPELKELEDMILGAEDKLVTLEYDLFCEVRSTIAAEVVRIQRTAKAVAGLDVFVSLALVADQNNYCRPKINENGIIDIKGGRHPVVEKMINNDMFIDNDTYLDNGNHRISIITGPNMAGKSTASISQFVPKQLMASQTPFSAVSPSVRLRIYGARIVFKVSVFKLKT